MVPSSLQITVDVPQELATGIRPEDLAEEARRLLVLDRFRRGDISAARAARILGLGRVAFLDLCASHGIPAIRYDLDDFRREIADIRKHGR